MNQNSEQTVLPYGQWPSTVTAALVANRIRLDDVRWAAGGETLVWQEGRQAGGALVSASASQSVPVDLTGEMNPRGGVGYGGGTFTLTPTDPALLVFANRDGRLYRRGLGSEPPRPVTPLIGPNGAVASPALSPDGAWVVYVYTDGKTDLLAVASTSGSEWPAQLARGADFYMQPAWHPQGTHLAWVEWDRPNMPWDGTRVMLARFENDPPRLVDVKTVAGGGDVPAQQPLFSPDGRWLSWLEENGEWANLVLLDLQSGEQRVLVEGQAFDLLPPAWVQGMHTYGWSASSQRLYQLRQFGPSVSLWVTGVEDGLSAQIDTSPYTWLGQLSVSPAGERLAFVASAADQPDVIVTWEADGSAPAMRVVAHSTPATYDPASLPPGREITWQAEDGSAVHALYFAPTNPRAKGSGMPPALVHIHGGPTSYVSTRFNTQAAYFTSRGYAYVEVNYRGSTGYGRAYRHAMRHRWGDVDVEDAAACARALGEQQLADPGKLVIIGGSAGGYTVLNTLIRYPGLYKAGICLFGVTNLFALDMDSHKFEAHYNYTMIGPLPGAAERYHAWSPVFHAERIRDALYIFQGADDNVVPPSQSEEIVEVLRARGIPHQYKLYEGEGHGFRKSETITDFLKETERFIRQHVLFAP